VEAIQFWSIATLMVVATTAAIVLPLFRQMRGPLDVADASTAPLAGWRWYALGIAAVIPIVALAVYALIGSPGHAVSPVSSAGDAATLHARVAMRGGGKDGGDLDAATERLRARLTAEPNDADGWRLLVQSYEFQGRAREAAEARAHLDPTSPPSPRPAAGGTPDADSIRLAQTAEQHRRKREFAQAIEAFAELARRGDMSADLWADYADALGGARGKLDDEAAGLIDAALRIAPDHPKALWLRATWQTEKRDHVAALATWERLAAILPADSPDARIIAANLGEARGKVSARPDTPRSGSGAPPIVLRGSVRIDPRWKGRVAADAVLFVVARAADERGPPLAVVRTAAGPWPHSFALDDSNAMMPGRKLSDFTRVILEARISRSGNALAQPGDLRAVSAVLNPRASPPQVLTIAEEVPTPPAKGG
jgi:cytochrome c-type biogenesis protein CcmH